MPSRVPSARLSVFASAVTAGVLLLQPVSSIAQAAPMSTPASCAAPVLDLANPAPGAMLVPGAYTIEGLALDPLAQQGSGIDQVSVFLGNRDQGGIELGSTVPGSAQNPDAFNLTVSLPTTQVGEFQFTAYALSLLTGKETQVSLPIVLGEDPSKAALPAGTATESSTNPGTAPLNCEAAPGAPMVTTGAPAPSIAPAVGAPTTQTVAPATETGVAPNDTGVTAPASQIDVTCPTGDGNECMGQPTNSQ
jgi:hypothetical protein